MDSSRFDELSNDVFELILGFLLDDGVAVGRLSLCSVGLHQRIKASNEIWKELYSYRWSRSCSLDRSELESKYREEYFRRHVLDQHVSNLLFGMTDDLQQILNLTDDEENNKVDGDPHIGQAWDHITWKTILMYRDEVTDVLRLHARENSPLSPGVHQRLLGFLACRCLQNIQFGECLSDWKRLTFNDTYHMGEFNIKLMERYAILICQIQQTPEEQMECPKHGVAEDVSNRLDTMAKECSERIEQRCTETGKTLTVVEKLLLVKDILVKEHQFKGNTENYYDYRNSLLRHVLDVKKGIPLTLCVLFACVCRRLKLHTFLVGLPGHVVLGFEDHTKKDENGLYVPDDPLYLDVFRTGQVLSVDDCQRICASYGVGWSDQFLRPLTASQVLDRTFNNLSNCHLQAMAEDAPSPFRSDLFFQQRALASIHRQPKSIAGALVERITQELPLTLSPELLKHYNLLSSSHLPVGNT
eukprot:scaffold22583_cov106-Cylindrotheca_fusiformis.AAC.5